jgi:hypothetical protein
MRLNKYEEKGARSKEQGEKAKTVIPYPPLAEVSQRDGGG